MPLTITKASDPIEVKQITTCIYAAPGLGKTSTGFTAAAPLLLDFDHGAYRSQFRGDTVQIETWDDVDAITGPDLARHKTVVIDTVGRALDALSASLIARNAKLKGYGGALSLQGYGALKSSFIGWLRMLHSFGKDVVLLAHVDEQRNGDEIIERLDVQGGSKGEIYKCADAMGRLQMAGGKRVLNFNPSDTAFGKNPAQLGVLPVPDYHQEPQFLASVIATIKAKLNESSEAAQAEQAILQDYRETFNALTTPEEFTEKVGELAKAEPTVKALLVQIADIKGFKFDKSAKAFTATAK